MIGKTFMHVSVEEKKKNIIELKFSTFVSGKISTTFILLSKSFKFFFTV